MADPYMDYGQPAGMGMTPYDIGLNAPAPRTNTAFQFNKGGNDWRTGVNRPAPDYGGNDTTANTIKTTTNMLSTGATMLGPSTGGAGFIVAGLIQLAGGILGAMARKKPPRNPEDVAFERMIKFYRDLGKKSDVARSVASLFTGKPKSSFTNIGYNSAVDAYRRNPDAYKNSSINFTGE